jgi:predicted transglutaminase-like cysteine proteinase
MYRSVGGVVAWLIVAGALLSAEPGKQDPAGKLVRDLWDAAYLDSARAGYIRTTVRETEKDGTKYFHTTVTLELTLRRFQDVIRQQMESGTVETADGKVTAVSMRQSLGKEQQMALTGTVEGDKLRVKVSGDYNMEKSIRWNDQVVGLYREQQLYKEKKAKPGDKFSYQHYEPLINAVVTVQVTVKDFEEVAIHGQKQKLLRTEAIPDKIMGAQLPATTFWLDKDLQVQASRVEMPGLGRLSVTRSTREECLKPVTPAKITDIGLTQLIPLNRRIPKAHDSSAVVYKITLAADDEPAKAFAADSRQEIKNAKGKSFELHVKAVRKPEEKKNVPEAAEEFLKSNYFINCDDAKVQELAKKAVGAEKDSWQKALKIEKWVNKNMKIQNFSEAMATADHVAKTLEGDCTEYAMLTAAMCRAVGVPSRTALGFVYVDMAKGPVFGYHMWTEVYVQGQWLALDATLGKGSVGAGHIKITDHSWYDTRSLAPLLPVMRVMLGKPAIEVVQVE